MRDQVEQTRIIAEETEKQVAIMDKQFKKEYEPFFVCHEIGADEVNNTEIQGSILVENIGGVATTFEGFLRNDPEIKIEFSTFDIFTDQSRRRKGNFRDAAYLGNRQQCYLKINIPYKNDQEKYQLHPFLIHYKDMLGRHFELEANYQLSSNMTKGERAFGTGAIGIQKEDVFPSPAEQVLP